MKRLCGIALILVLLGHQAQAFPKKKNFNSKLSSVPVEHLKVVADPVATIFTLNPWLSLTLPWNPIQPRIGDLMADQTWAKKMRKHQKLNILNSMPVKNSKDQVKIGGEMIPGKLRQSSCGAEFNSNSGTIRFPSNGGNYQNNEDCTWIIRATNPIEITFTSFSVEALYDYLYVRDGESFGSAVLGDLTGNSIPSPIETSTNTAYLRFYSDYSVTTTGFELSWEPANEDTTTSKAPTTTEQTIQGCGGEISDNSGVLNFPSNGGNYRNDENCIWIIRTDKPITITFESFDIEQSYDFLYVRNGVNSGSPLLERLSGDTVPSPVQTTANGAYLLFTSDSSVTSTGFEFFWEPSDEDTTTTIPLTTTDEDTTTTIPPSTTEQTIQGCGGEYLADSGILQFPLDGGNYQNNENCTWIILSSGPITITFDSFNTEDNYDFLCVHNVEIRQSDSLGCFSGASVPSPIQTTSNGAYLVFTSDHSVTSTGFTIFWDLSGTSTSEDPTTVASTTAFTNTPSPTGGSDCACGQANRASRIVNGIETEENEYPWQAALVYSSSSSVFCGASVIGSKHILTAAHCTQAVTDYSLSYQVLVGAHGLTTAASSQLRFEPTRFIQHPDYVSSTVDNDISIIVLSDHIDFISSEIRPVCLPDNDADAYDSVTATVSGWGTIESGGSQPDVLLEVDVPTISNTQCLDYYGAGRITQNMLCAGFEEGGKDSCQGDSGGPLIYNSGSGYTQIGVVSWGIGCASPGYPGVYARITKYLSWISDNSASSNTCPEA